ncbi:MAG: ribbon-helix-helix protein, CopG family [Oscillatoriales cyanobacterium RU_3_3]|jgi:predicted DNA-binding protein|nr:ribbon-helix-helix protein, CopG family [Microcoleus sp. SU_5_6]NJL69658.1 ribbon-helix-helix protein, CopG family [Microcoleus sp. SM1_3_4]NJM60432.1 ribbon-helix-helix protein, CopG family [Oscillatoriales cyanobacterium RU_3_3]NJR24634.1 ribbon-helix-helix protein, CopG family [Richelia sp. CSU_2_1]
MSKNVKVLTIRLPEAEMLRLEAYCENSGRTKTDVIREQIRNLKVEDKSLHSDRSP